jgi:hypothetical protein
LGCFVAVAVVIDIAGSRWLMTGSADQNGSSWRIQTESLIERFIGDSAHLLHANPKAEHPASSTTVPEIVRKDCAKWCPAG